MAGVTDAELAAMNQEDRVAALGMTTEQLTGRTTMIEFNPDEEERFAYPWAPEVFYNKRADLDTSELSTTATVTSRLKILVESTLWVWAF